MLSEKQKRIYNSHLVNSRKQKNKPFNIKKDFSNINETTKNILIKLEYLFNKYPDVDIDTYFAAPYNIWPDIEYFPLEYYTSPPATRAYTLYKKQQIDQDIDSDDTINKIKESITFIAKFCHLNGISLDQYYTYKQGITYSWMTHIRKTNIIPYVVFGFKNIDNIFFNSQEDERDLLMGTFAEKYYIYKNKFNKSKKAKHIIIEGLNRIKHWINKENELKKNNNTI
jgi:hypothetical protein